MKGNNYLSIQQWLIRELTRSVSGYLLVVLAIAFLADLGVMAFNEVRILNRSAYSFLKAQEKDLQVFDYTLIPDNLVQFGQETGASYVVLRSSEGYAAGMWTAPMSVALDSSELPTGSRRVFTRGLSIYWLEPATLIVPSTGIVYTLDVVYPFFGFAKLPAIRALFLILVLGSILLRTRRVINHSSQYVSSRVQNFSSVMSQLRSTDDRVVTEVQDGLEISEFAELKDRFIQLLGTLKKSEQERVEAQKLASVVDLASSVAHDIRSPLNALSLTVNSIDGEVKREQLEILKASMSRLHGIAGDLLALNRGLKQAQANVSDNPEHVVPPRISLSTLISSVLDEKKIELGGDTKVCFDVDQLRAERDAEIRANPGEIQRVISNLLNNAIEAFSDGGMISLAIEHHPTEIALHISDNGPGIPAERLSVLGRRGQTFGKKEGTGLGLYSAHEALKKYHGRLEISSAVGRGTKVSIILPRAN